jgi:hypothetical protein
MGCWSIYCGISQIAITSGDKCVLLPLKKERNGDYLPYLPATLPIFGEYDDYGGLVNIEETEYTKFLEEYFGIPILDFTKIFTDWKTYQRDETKPIIEACKHFDEVDKWEFMFIDRKVYDYMSTTVTDEHDKGTLDFGNKGMLEFLGFTHIGIDENNPTYDPKRFNDVWEFEGRKFYSDGNTISVMGNRKDSDYVMYFDSKHSKEFSLCNFANIPEDKRWIGDKSSWQLWKLHTPKKQRELLTWIIGDRYHDDGFDTLEEMLFEAAIKAGADPVELAEKTAPKNIKGIYVKNLDKFGDGLCELVTIRHNLSAMSGYFAPFIKYLTPQDGAPFEHQKLLKKFAEINGEKLSERGYEDEDEDDEL